MERQTSQASQAWSPSPVFCGVMEEIDADACLVFLLLEFIFVSSIGCEVYAAMLAVSCSCCPPSYCCWSLFAVCFFLPIGGNFVYEACECRDK